MNLPFGMIFNSSFEVVCASGVECAINTFENVNVVHNEVDLIRPLKFIKIIEKVLFEQGQRI